MSKLPPSVLAFMFLCSAASVLVIAYRYLSRYPLGTMACCLVALGVLARWYVLARRGDEQTATRTFRKLTMFLVVLVLIVPYLLRLLPKP